MKNVVFWDVMPCGYCKNRCFAGTYRLYHQGDKNRQDRNVSSNKQPMASVLLRWLFIAYVVPSTLILVTLMMEAICSSEISVLTRVTGSNIKEDGIHHSHTNLNSCLCTKIHGNILANALVSIKLKTVSVSLPFRVNQHIVSHTVTPMLLNISGCQT
jgi:hypothetical protein